MAQNEIQSIILYFKDGRTADVTDYARLPLSWETVLDSTHASGKLLLSDMTDGCIGTIEAGKAFESFTTIEIKFIGQSTTIRLLIAHDDCEDVRKDNYKTYSHSLTLIDELKLTEREPVDTLTFTNPLPRDNDVDPNRDAVWAIYGEEDEGDTWEGWWNPSNSIDEIANTNEWTPPTLKMLQTGTTLTFSNNINTFDRKNDGGQTRDWKYIISFQTKIIDPYGDVTSYDSALLPHNNATNANRRYDAESYTVDISLSGTYLIEFEWSWSERVGLALPNKHYISASAYIIVQRAGEIKVEPYTLADTIKRVLDLTPTRKTTQTNVWSFDGNQLDEYENEQSPEFAFTGNTLFEVLDAIAGYKGAFPKCVNKTLSFRPMWNGVVLSEDELPAPIKSINSSDMEQYCTYLDCDVQNLVCVNDTLVGSITEPYRGGWKTMRSADSSEISQDTACVLTSEKMYQNISLEMGATAGQIIGDITGYTYEEGEYNSLSDTSAGYPDSKAYAVKWQQMGENYTEFSHRITSSSSTLFSAFTNPAISNIAYAKSGAIVNGTNIYSYLCGLVGMQNGDSFADLSFRATYIPAVDARLRQYKDCLGGFNTPSGLKYNQTAELVDSEMLGEHLKGLIRKLGNATKAKIYIFDKVDDVPEVGTLIDGYSIYDVAMTIYKNRVVATICFVKYAELSRYVGVKNAWKDSDVSEDKAYRRNISINKFLRITASPTNHAKHSDILEDYGLTELLPRVSSNEAKISVVQATGYDLNNKPLNTVFLSVVSLAIGNSLYFGWKYKTNYAADYMSEKAPEGATNVITGTQYARARKAVRYSDSYGRLKTYDFLLSTTGPTFENIHGAASSPWWVENLLPPETPGLRGYELAQVGDTGDYLFEHIEFGRRSVSVQRRAPFPYTLNYYINCTFRRYAFTGTDVNLVIGSNMISVEDSATAKFWANSDTALDVFGRWQIDRDGTWEATINPAAEALLSQAQITVGGAVINAANVENFLSGQGYSFIEQFTPYNCMDAIFGNWSVQNLRPLYYVFISTCNTNNVPLLKITGNGYSFYAHVINGDDDDVDTGTTINPAAPVGNMSYQEESTTFIISVPANSTEVSTGSIMYNCGSPTWSITSNPQYVGKTRTFVLVQNNGATTGTDSHISVDTTGTALEITVNHTVAVPMTVMFAAKNSSGAIVAQYEELNAGATYSAVFSALPDGAAVTAGYEMFLDNTDAATIYNNTNNPNEVIKRIAHSLPLKDECLCSGIEDGERVPWNPLSFLHMENVLVDKNSSEALSFGVQLHYITEEEQIIVGSGLTNLSPLIGAKVTEVALYGFNSRLNLFNRRIVKSNGTRLVNYPSAVDSMATEENGKLKITLPVSVDNYSAWAIVGTNSDGVSQIILGANKPIDGSGFIKTLYIEPIEEF